MKQALLLSAAILLLAAPATLLAGPEEERLYNAVLAATFTDEKTRHAEQLARLGTADAKAKLLVILAEKSSWNREAAARGLALIGDTQVSRALLDRMLTDIMVEKAIRDGFIRNISLHYAYLASAYPAGDRKARAGIIGIIGESRVPRGEAFLKGIVDDESSEDRGLAFESLAHNYPAGNYAYIRGRKDTAQFRFIALAYLAEKGTPDDLALFRDIVDRREEAQYMLVAFKGINRLGDDPLKHRVFTGALAGADDSVAQGAMYIFTGVRSDRVRELLCRQVKKGGSQSVRMTALSRLREYDTPDIIPSLVMGLDERFIHYERGGGDMFATIITIGISSIFEDLHQKQRKKTFESDRKEIAAHLKKITGADNGTSYEKWLEWAVASGHTVNGVNLVQRLFSGYRATREKATESAIRLLGYPSARDFFARNGGFASDGELALALARMLIEKGYLKDEE